ncbi:MAG TPA: diguanylate cyclase [Candidatus Acidoferrales bacterium]|jgi:two-component system cell cycle response regulator|nr:diguanylate cyclase [Candidatus Acidoferrales bacterium]
MSGFSVLVADDSPVYRKLVEHALAEDSCSVSFASSGHQAIEILEREHPDLVVTDWMMPDLTGIELCHRIRTNAESSYTYVIILTSNAEKENVVKGLSAGADDYLTKPFDRNELLARVHVGRRLIDLHRQIEAKNKLLEELALTDPLTGLPNRRAIEDWSARQLSGAARHGFPIWVVLMDLDHFKNVNDTYGHDAGDTVLKKFGEVLRANTRLSDISGRIGGEEFLLVLTHADQSSVAVVLGRIRQQLAAERFEWNGSAIHVTASFGVAGFSGKKAPEFKQLLKQADAALYRAKDLGRNRIELEPVNSF